MSVKNSVQIIKFAFKKHPLKPSSNPSFAQSRTLHSINVVRSRSSLQSSSFTACSRATLDSICYYKVIQNNRLEYVTQADKNSLKSNQSVGQLGPLRAKQELLRLVWGQLDKPTF